MAKEDAAEQVKEVVRLLIRHRFWIAVGFAALFAVIAYFMGAGPVQAKATAEKTKIINAEKDVRVYSDKSKPIPLYVPVVEEKTNIVSKDVNKAWKELYDRQAPLLTWPKIVQSRIIKWGRQWPENEDAGNVTLAIVDYIMAYNEYVDMVYSTFQPFDYETGKGIVAAAPKKVLLRPAEFAIEKPPTLGKVWMAQERLWIQRTLLEVVAEVNKKAQAKDWDSAIIKEIVSLEVGNQVSQDQRSLAKGDQLTEAADVLSPAQKAAADAADSGSGAGGGGGGMSMSMGGGGAGGAGRGRGGPMGGMSGMGGGIMKNDESVFYVTPSVDKNQYKILPISITVLIDQEHVQDFLVELENSPMSIDVKDFELERPSSRVTKPEKGEQRAGMGSMGSMGGMSGMMRGMMTSQGYGGMASQMRSRMMGGGMGMGMGNRSMGMGTGGMSGNNAADQRKKVDTSNINRKEEREKKDKAVEEQKGPSLFDPYFNIVEVKVYGQARFYLPPTAEAAEPSSPGDVAASPAAPAAAAGATPPAAGAPATPGTAPDAAEKPATPPGTAPTEPEKSDASKPADGADAKSAPPKSDAAAPATKPEPAKPGDAPKAAAPATETPKADAKAAAVKQ